MEIFPDTVRSIGSYIIFYQCGTTDHGIHVPGPVSQSSAESEYNAAFTAGSSSGHFRMLIHEFLNKDPDIFNEGTPLTVLDSKSAVCMDNNGKDTNHTRHITIIVHFVSNGENCKMHIIDWCEGVLHLAYIATNNVGENDLNPKMKYIVLRLDN